MDVNQKAKKYSTIKYALAIFDLFFFLLILVLFQSLGLSQALRDSVFSLTTNSPLATLLYSLVAFLVYYLINFPLNIYRSYFLEHKFSLSNQKLNDWLGDQLKSGMIAFIIFAILVQVIFLVLRIYPQKWWIAVSVFWIFFSLILAKVTPTLIIPLFFKYKDLPDQVLKERILALAKKMKVKILDVFEIDFSKKTLKANAAFVGLGKTKRILLADTLKDKYTHDEIEVILAHEFAHYQLKHLLKSVLMNSATIIACYYIIYKTSGYALSIFNLSSMSDLASLPIIFIYLTLFGMVMQPVENYISRRFEVSADKTALKVTGMKDAFISMMSKLGDQNLADRKPAKIIKFFFFSHPPIDERIEMAKNKL